MIYETVIGLEVHVELATKTKIFCGCTTEFGGEPNTHVCPVCLGLPGSLPVLNKQAVEYALRAALETHCSINKTNIFDRKNYFYPDLPKAYQISQLYTPLCQNGYMMIEIKGEAKRIGIHEIHMEEDAGKLVHDAWEDCSLIDYNRCGVPLIEIVSEPDFCDADEVIAYLEKLRETLLFLEVSDCKMQEGSMRADINLSVRPIGSDKLGIRTEMKNMNSFKAIHKAIIFESARQIEVLEAGGKIIQETRRWDDNKDASFVMRTKENAHDYRYFPEPDLQPMHISEEWLMSIKEGLPESAEKKRNRYSKMGLSEYDAQLLTSEKQFSDLFDSTIAIFNKPKEVSNMITGEIMRLLKESSMSVDEMKVNPNKLASLIQLICNGTINRNIGKEIMQQIFLHDVEPDAYITEHGLGIVNDQAMIEQSIDNTLAKNEKSVTDFINGKEKAFGYLVGQVMKELKGKGNPQIVNELLRKKLEGF